MGRVQAAGGVGQHQLPLRRGRAPVPVRQRRPRRPRVPAGVRPPGRRRARRVADAPPRHRDRGRQRRRPRRPRRGGVRSGRGLGLARARLRAPLPRRPLHPLHGRHHGHAEGCRLAARGRLLRAGRRHRRRRRHEGGPARADGREGARAGTHDVAPDRAAHARRDAVGCHGRQLRRQQDRPRVEVRRPSRLAARRRGRRQPDHDHRRRDGSSAHRDDRAAG